MALSRAVGKCIKQQFEHLLVLDFEATCDKKHQPNPQEIIEFPVVILRSSDGKIMDEFHHYIKPRFHPQLSVFCTELTGIIQSTVDGGMLLDNVLQNFDEWLTKRSLGQFAFVTCGDWDLGKQLRTQCKFYNLPVPSYFHKWINLKQIFAQHTGTWPRGMPHMLNLLNLPLIGHHHSGIDDCRNIAAITCTLLKQGAEFSFTSSLQKDTGPHVGIP